MPWLLPLGGVAAALVLSLVWWRSETSPTAVSLTASLPLLLPPIEGNDALFPDPIAFADPGSHPSDGLLPFYLHLNF